MLEVAKRTVSGFHHDQSTPFTAKNKIKHCLSDFGRKTDVHSLLKCIGQDYLSKGDMRYIFLSYRDTNVHGIDGRIDGERRKYTKSHSAAATSVGPHTYIRIPLRCCVYIL